MTDETDDRNVWRLFHELPRDGNVWWFRKGILPMYAPDLVFDEWSYYLGFDPRLADAMHIHSLLAGDISPSRSFFDFLETTPWVYLMFVDDGWWEGYTNDAELNCALERSWQGRPVRSDRWTEPRRDPYPYPEDAK